MIKQLKYDSKMIMWQRRYTLLLIAVVLLSCAYAFLLSQAGLNSNAVVNNGLQTFRPLYWLLCCYLICEIVSCDYHDKTLKLTIPHVKSRSCYLISKIIVSAGTCLLMWILHLLSSNLIAMACSLNHTWGGGFSAFLDLCAGSALGILFFQGLIILCIVVWENEAVAIGCSLGTAFILFVLENIETITNYIPTMWSLSFASAGESGFELLWVIIAALMLLIFISLLMTARIFMKKDLFT